jgi:hypothetical protein
MACFLTALENHQKKPVPTAAETTTTRNLSIFTVPIDSPVDPETSRADSPNLSRPFYHHGNK